MTSMKYMTSEEVNDLLRDEIKELADYVQRESYNLNVVKVMLSEIKKISRRLQKRSNYYRLLK